MDRDPQKIWNNCLKIIKDNVPSMSFRTWFSPIVPLRVRENILTIQVPSPFFYEYLEEQYIDILRKTLRKELGHDAKLEYNVVVENKSYSNNQAYTVRYPEKNQKVPRNRPVSLPAGSDDNSIKNPFIIPGIQKLQINAQLNSSYTFKNYIEGECNRLARSAGVAVAKNPGGTAFNPLFFYGESGLGKTHLAQAIGIEIKEKLPEKIVLYVSANKFQTQFVDAIKKNNKNDFLHFYQMIDVLIIDDVQEFAGKEKTQETFFHIFNHLHQSGKQIILTSDKAPVELMGLTQRLLSRFKWGLSADLQRPDYETKKAILTQIIYKDGMEISDEVIEFLATNVNSSVRELEGTLISLLAHSTLTKQAITIELAEKVIRKIIKSTQNDITVDKIKNVVCGYFNMKLELLQSKTRKREIVQARQIAMYFSKNLTSSSLTAIGAEIGGKDHATVLHACRTISNLVDTDKRFKKYIDDIKKKLYS